MDPLFPITQTRPTMAHPTCLLLLCLIILGHPGLLEAQEWELKKEEDGIRVYLREAKDSKIKEVRITMEVQASLSAVVSVLRDPDAYAEWVYKCAESRLLGEADKKECMYYSRIDFPWPIKDRDLVARSSLVQDPNTKQITIRSVAHEGQLPEQKDAVRIPAMESRWILTPLSNGKVQMENRIWSDPGGSLPAWLVNMAVDKGPTQTMTRLRDRLGKAKYLSAHVDYILN